MRIRILCKDQGFLRLTRFYCTTVLVPLVVKDSEPELVHYT